MEGFCSLEGGKQHLRRVQIQKRFFARDAYRKAQGRSARGAYGLVKIPGLHDLNFRPCGVRLANIVVARGNSNIISRNGVSASWKPLQKMRFSCSGVNYLERGYKVPRGVLPYYLLAASIPPAGGKDTAWPFELFSQVNVGIWLVRISTL